ncbi:MAG: DUF898 family protein [Anaerovoracaceae bacterium]|jgi:uncharacterized membrane protein YjgN (DUF898 family)
MADIMLNVNGGDAEVNSYFDGGLLQSIGWTLLGILITLCTLGICYPWALCMLYGWKIKHTVINGRRLNFNGTAMGLFGNWIKWLLLCIVTVGIYSFWLGIALEKWKVKHTSFAN